MMLTDETRRLSVRNVSKTFQTAKGNSVHALDNISFDLDVSRGRIIVFLGPSGCGKTTLLRIIAALEKATSGEVLFDGKKQQRGWASVVFQEFSLFPWLSIRENVEFGLRMEQTPAKERRIEGLEYLRKVGLDQFAESHPNELSGGMKQRVALARSLAVKTPLVLMDEPFGSLDMLTREKMYDFIWETWRNNDLSGILVTHNVDEAVLLGDTIYLLSAAPARIVETIKSPFKPADRFGTNRALDDMIRSVKAKILAAAEATSSIDNVSCLPSNACED